ncbi:acetoacetate decarboxylase family protein [Metabacillus dongyingensis]|uniref:acetoacetate decarboxylase family protein n=1 Tax=Metabacillus dongyingensis TaxID=2874282 RepID=UPI003B8E3DF6
MCNSPLHSPSYPSPFVPYECLGQTSLSVYFRPNREILQEWVKTTPYKLEENIAVAVVTDFSNCDKVSYMDFAIVVPVSYDGKRGGWYVFEYEDNDAAIAAGRELWGYPKKYASISLEQDGDTIIGKAERNDGLSIEVKGIPGEPEGIPEVIIYPHFNIRSIPNPDKSGVWRNQLIQRNTSSDFKLHSRQLLKGSIQFQGTQDNPLHLLGEGPILGAVYTSGDFYATETNGWGKIIKEW